jgi:pimeloyl-ACP methyl ester carboxylesterase
MAFLVCGCAGFKRSLFESGLSLERKLSGMEEKTITVNELSVSYLERPGVGETIVLLHGFSADKDNWVRFTRHLPEYYRVIAIDLPGHGSTTRDFNSTYSIDYITQGFANTVDALKIKRFHLAGNSMGGYVSALYSARHPARVQTLCLIDPAGATSPQPSDREISLSRGVNPLVPKTLFEFDNTLSYGFYRQPFLPWPARSVYAQRYIERSSFNEKMWSDIMENRVDVERYLGDISMPTLLMWGDRDRIIHISTVEVFLKGIPKIKTVIFKDCGHMPMVEIPRESATAYTSFLEEIINAGQHLSLNEDE